MGILQMLKPIELHGKNGKVVFDDEKVQMCFAQVFEFTIREPFALVFSNCVRQTDLGIDAVAYLGKTSPENCVNLRLSEKKDSILMHLNSLLATPPV
jgi:hypothetical protein